MKPENAINFMLYSYFEITLDSGHDDIIDAAVRRAYRDASSHVLALDNKNKNDDTPKKECIKQIKSFISELSEIKSSEDYTEKHGQLCKHLAEQYNGKTKEGYEFTCGIAQKWINMTMKYLCVILSIFEKFREDSDWCAKYSNILRNCEPFFHIPIDSFILEFISQNPDKEQKFDDALHIQIPAKPDGKKSGYYSDRSLAWSKYKEYNKYKEVEEEIKEKITGIPLDWEGPAWIKVSQKRNKKKK